MEEPHGILRVGAHDRDAARAGGACAHDDVARLAKGLRGVRDAHELDLKPELVGDGAGHVDVIALHRPIVGREAPRYARRGVEAHGERAILDDGGRRELRGDGGRLLGARLGHAGGAERLLERRDGVRAAGERDSRRRGEECDATASERLVACHRVSSPFVRFGRPRARRGPPGSALPSVCLVQLTWYLTPHSRTGTVAALRRGGATTGPLARGTFCPWLNGRCGLLLGRAMLARTRTPELTWIPWPSSGMDLGRLLA